MTQPRQPRVPEKTVQAQIVRLLRSLGATVYVIGHPSPADGRRHRGTGQTPGLPDLLVYWPPRYCPGRPLQSGFWLWIEVKAPGGRLRPEQAQFRERCVEAGMPHVVGDLDAVIVWLTKRAYLRDEIRRREQVKEAVIKEFTHTDFRLGFDVSQRVFENGTVSQDKPKQKQKPR